MCSLIKQLSSCCSSFQDVVIDSRLVKRGDLFLCFPSASERFKRFILEADRKGAKAIVSYKNFKGTLTASFFHDPCVEKKLNDLCLWVYGNPWESMNIIAITGTDGKTSMSYMIESMLSSLGFKVGVLGTVNYRIGHDILDREQHTTPPSPVLYRWGRECQKKGVSFLIIEASSHGLKQNRLQGIPIKVGIFTNLSHDHLDYHKTHDDYMKSKRMLFDSLKSSDFAIVNADDPFTTQMMEFCHANILSFGFSSGADVRGINLGDSQVSVETPLGHKTIQHRLIGDHNILNMLGTVAVGLIFNIDLVSIKKVFENPIMIPGRMECYECDDRLCVIDYAHTPRSLECLLQAIGKTYPKALLWLVFGCGGNRDREKRSVMGKIASQYAHKIVVTSDNPRFENPQKIMEDICVGIPWTHNIFMIENRAKAIAFAFKESQRGDILVIAGKGHESYQDILGVKSSYTDLSVLEELKGDSFLKERAGRM